ncbi:hypothetical protein [Bacillus sp. FJAT-50079]|uniref:hypothetical protein n=1 Tax=Bacillus sp. FJAT-50079 TaxID=2833577 RepID=UPI001BCA2004|nr:hypothetical protein [Bacillus sp. FJAT-50079]MBS4208771.1 hypothetical protein [Bacillus sp. FJAT-50079]
MKKQNIDESIHYSEEENRQTMKQIMDVYSLGVVEEMDEHKQKYEQNQPEE